MKQKVSMFTVVSLSRQCLNSCCRHHLRHRLSSVKGSTKRLVSRRAFFSKDLIIIPPRKRDGKHLWSFYHLLRHEDTVVVRSLLWRFIHVLNRIAAQIVYYLNYHKCTDLFYLSQLSKCYIPHFNPHLSSSPTYCIQPDLPWGGW